MEDQHYLPDDNQLIIKNEFFLAGVNTKIDDNWPAKPNYTPQSVEDRKGFDISKEKHNGSQKGEEESANEARREALDTGCVAQT